MLVSGFKTICICLFCFCFTSCIYFEKEFKTIKSVEKGDYAKAHQLLSKAKPKEDALSALAYALFYAESNNPYFNLDSARLYTFRGENQWENTRPYSQRWIKNTFEGDSIFFVIRFKVDSLAFENACQINTESSYSEFITQFPNANQIDSARTLMHQRAFERAQEVNDYQAFNNFLKKYPDSRQAAQAKEIYELLLYETSTKNGDSISYAQFVTNNPSSPYLEEALFELFRIYTIANVEQGFKKFIEVFPNSKWSTTARNWIEAYNERDFLEKPGILLPKSDSSGFYIYTNEHVNKSITIQRIYDHDPCEALYKTYDIFEKDNAWGMLKNLEVFIEPEFDNLQILNKTILQYKKKDKTGLMYVWGQPIPKIYLDSVFVLNDQLLAYQKDGKWGIMAMNGKTLFNAETDQIRVLADSLLVLKNTNGEVAIHTKHLLQNAQGSKNLIYFDSIYFREQYLVRSIRQQHILTNCQDGDSILLLGNQPSIWNHGFITFRDGNKILYDTQGNQLTQETDSVIFAGEIGYLIKADTIYELNIFGQTTKRADGAKCYDPFFCIANFITSDTIYTKSSTISMSEYENWRFEIIRSNDKLSSVFHVQYDGKWGLIDENGEKLIPIIYDEIRIFDENLIRVKNKGKYSLLSFKGERRLKNDYDAISNYQNGGLVLFSKGKFGYYHFEDDIYFPPKYSSSFETLTLTDHLFIKSENEKKIIDKKGETLMESYEEYIRINDSLIFAKKDFQWYLFEYKNATFGKDAILKCDDYDLDDAQNDGSFYFYRSTGMGYFHAQSAEFLYPEFYSIQPIMDHENDLSFYITFKYFEEIELFFLQVLNQEGHEMHKSILSKNISDSLECDPNL